MKIPFKHYLHGGKEAGWDLAERFQHFFDGEMTEEQKRELAMTFYEVTLHCEYDTDTKKINLLRAEL